MYERSLTALVILTLLGVIFYLYATPKIVVQTIPGTAQPVMANLADWQPLFCETDGKPTVCRLEPGDELLVSGFVQNDNIRLLSDNKIANIGPDGLTDKTSVTLPFVPTFPRFALLGHRTDSHGNPGGGKSFLIGRRYRVTSAMYLALLINGDYFYCYGGCAKEGKPMAHPEWFNHNSGIFSVTIKRTS